MCINNRRKRSLRLGIHFSKILCTMLKWSPSLCNSYTTRFGVINNLMSSVGILFHFIGDLQPSLQLPWKPNFLGLGLCSLFLPPFAFLMGGIAFPPAISLGIISLIMNISLCDALFCHVLASGFRRLCSRRNALSNSPFQEVRTQGQRWLSSQGPLRTLPGS